MGTCGICTGDPARRAYVNAELVKGTPHIRIEAESRVLGMPVKRETIRRHVNICVAAGVHNLEVPPKVPVPKSGRESNKGVISSLDSLPEGDDFATLVKSAAVEKLRKGELRISTQDGLAAQALLDRRAEKQRDRDVFTKIGMLLAGAASLPPPIVIEGQAKEVLRIEAGEQQPS